MTLAGGLRGQVVVLAATSFPWGLDDALRRRLEKRVYIPLPNVDGRRRLFENSLKSVNLSDGVDLEVLAQKAEGYSGADITSVCRDASMIGVRQKMIGRSATEIQVW